MIFHIYSLAIVLGFAATLSQCVTYQERMEAELQIMRSEWAEARHKIWAAHRVQDFVYGGGINLAKKARILEKYKSPDPRNTAAVEEHRREMERNIVRIVEKEYKRDMMFLAENGEVAAWTARNIIEAIETMRKWHPRWRDMALALKGPNRQGEMFMAPQWVFQEAHENMRYIKDMWAAYGGSKGIKAITIICTKVKDIIPSLWKWFPVVLSSFAEPPVDVRLYLKALTKRNYDNKWWLEFNKEILYQRRSYLARMERQTVYLAQGGAWTSNTIANLLFRTSNEFFVERSLLYRLKENFLYLIWEGLGRPHTTLLDVEGLGELVWSPRHMEGRRETIRRVMERGALTGGPGSRSLAELEAKIRGKDGRHGINEALEKALGMTLPRDTAAMRQSMGKYHRLQQARMGANPFGPGMIAEGAGNRLVAPSANTKNQLDEVMEVEDDNTQKANTGPLSINLKQNSEEQGHNLPTQMSQNVWNKLEFKYPELYNVDIKDDTESINSSSEDEDDENEDESEVDGEANNDDYEDGEESGDEGGDGRALSHPNISKKVKMV